MKCPRCNTTIAERNDDGDLSCFMCGWYEGSQRGPNAADRSTLAVEEASRLYKSAHRRKGYDDPPDRGEPTTFEARLRTGPFNRMQRVLWQEKNAMPQKRNNKGRALILKTPPRAATPPSVTR